MRFSRLILLFPFLLMGTTSAKVYSYRGYISTKALGYTAGDTNDHSGQRHRAEIEQHAQFNSRFELVNQFRWTYSSLYSDLSGPNLINKKDTNDMFLGDNYLKIKSNLDVLQIGYQDIAWGEAFGFNYADIINPKDMKETFYSDSSESRLPLFLVNYKFFFKNGSLQLIYSPEPRFSKSLPVSIFTKDVFPETNVITHVQKSPDFFKIHEYGGKLSTSFGGIDASIFYFSYLDRDPIYAIQTATLNSIDLKEIHDRNQSLGLSLANTIFSHFVLRTDFVYTENKRINSIDEYDLISTPLNVTNILVSLDTPSFAKFSAVLIFAGSFLSERIPQALREKEEIYSIAKLTYDFGEEKIIDLSYTREFANTAHALQFLYTWPVSSNLEIRLGAENYWGNENSQLNKIKSVSNVFFGIKSYFRL